MGASTPAALRTTRGNSSRRSWRSTGGCSVHGRLPVNVKVLIEGEEEIGSPNLAALVEERRNDLACSVAVVSDTPVLRRGQPTISLGTRGLMGVEIKVTGPNRDLHSGMYGGSVPNPIDVLCRMLAALHDDQGRVTVPGFYDHVFKLDPKLREEWRRLNFDDAAESKKLGCGLSGEAGFSTLERRWARPTLEINGITGGYQGPGSNTIVPSFASAKITCRLVPDQDAESLAQKLKQNLLHLAPSNVTVEFNPRKVNVPAYSIDASHPALRAAALAFEAVYQVKPVTVREGLTLPILPTFKRVARRRHGADGILPAGLPGPLVRRIFRHAGPAARRPHGRAVLRRIRAAMMSGDFKQILAADWTWTGQRFERDRAVHIGADGTIEQVAPIDPNDPKVQRLPNRALLPGFVNAHSHAFQRGLRREEQRFDAGAGRFLVLAADNVPLGRVARCGPVLRDIEAVLFRNAPRRDHQRRRISLSTSRRARS